MNIIKIKIADIDAENGMRMVDKTAVFQLAESILVRGLRQPIKVVAQTHGKEYRLISGSHRLAACVKLEYETISAIIISGNQAELRLDALLENLERSELSMLKQAYFLAELKAICTQRRHALRATSAQKPG